MVLVSSQSHRAVSVVTPEQFSENPEAYLDEDMVLLDNLNFDRTYQILKLIKQSKIPKLYLKPLALYKSVPTHEPYLERCFDMVFDHLDQKVLDEVTSGESLINMRYRIDKIKENDVDMEHPASLKILRHLFVRRESLEPFRNSKTIYGYSYPKIDMLFRQGDGSLFQTVEFLENNKLVTSEFHDTVHTCPECDSAFLNFKEACPDCLSSNLKADELVHHFVCAYVAPKDEFLDEDGKMTCPKCEKTLRHIGQDYDKPSTVFKCNACSKEFQEPYILGNCFHCGVTGDANDFQLMRVNKLSYTSSSDFTALFGFESLYKESFKDVNYVDLGSFKKYAEIEINRISRYKLSQSTVVSLQLVNLEEIYRSRRTIGNEFFEKLGEVIAVFLRTSDLLTSIDQKTFVMLLVETPPEGADVAMQRLEGHIVSLFRENLNFTINTKISVMDIGDNMKVETLMDRLVG